MICTRMLMSPGSRSSPKILVYITVAVLLSGFLLVLSQLADIKLLLKERQSDLKETYVPPIPVQQQQASHNGYMKKPAYWLWSKNAESVHMRHVRNVFRIAGYDRRDGDKEEWDVLWSHEYPFTKLKLKETLKEHQLVNHFPGMGFLTSKVDLAKVNSKYIPQAFELPKHKQEFLEYSKTHSDEMWVQKSNKHRGIRIIDIKDADLTASGTFLQKYISNPYLIDGRKFDIGIYTIITSVDPLRIYTFEGEWLLRFCPDDYRPFDRNNVDKYVVGANYSPTWEIPSLQYSFSRLKLTHKQTFLQYLMKKGHNIDVLKQEIHNAITEVVQAKQPELVRAVSQYPYGSRSFFEMMRFDFVLDDKLNVFLMEVNMSPNLSSEHTASNARFYERVVFTTLSLSGVATSTSRIGRKIPNDEVHAVVDDRDVAVADSGVCKKCEDQRTCSDETCMLCLPCMDPDLKAMLKAAYLEHVNRLEAKRVFPRNNQKSSSAMNVNDRLLSQWFAAKCKQSQEWC